MRRFNLAFVALVLGAIAARAEWSVVASEAQFSSDRSTEHRHLTARSEAGDEAALELAIFSPKTATLRVIDQPEGRASLAATMQRENCIAGVNGGYFDPKDAPVGLLVSDGRVVAPLVQAKLLSGVVSVANGRVQIQRPAEFSLKAKPSAARQCGPFLVERGKPIAGLNDTRSARRTFIGTSADRVVVGYCSHVTLAQLAEVLASMEPKIIRALNLDGGSSSGFWFNGENGVVSVRERKTVRDFIGVIAK